MVGIYKRNHNNFCGVKLCDLYDVRIESVGLE